MCVVNLCVEFDIDVLLFICLEEGMMFFFVGGELYVLVFVCEVFDVLGVGDIVIVMVVMMFGVGVLFVDVVVFVNCVVGIVVGKFGMVMVDYDELFY